MNRVISIIIAILGCFVFSQNAVGQSTLVPPSQTPPWLIEVGPGPEDLVIDPSQEYARLLISSCDRRERGIQGEIISYRLDDGSVQVLKRRGEPAGVKLNPHGIDLARVNGTWMLYVISHEGDRHPIYQYEVHSDHLNFVKGYWDPLIVSPNALTVFPDGSFMVCNDAAKHGSMMEKILKMRRSTIVYCDGRANYTVAASRLGMPAGMNHLGNTLFVSDATGNKIYTFRISDGALSQKKKLCRIKGPDNIRFTAGGELLVAAHEKTLRFVRHVSNPTVPSPTVIYRIDPATGAKTRIFSDTGSLISAGSVAVEWEGYLYIGQIFESHLLKTVTLSNLL